MTLQRILKNRLKGAEKIAVLGVGSELKGDDAAGMLVARQIKQRGRKMHAQKPVKVFLGSTAPENITGEIREFAPSHLLIIDAACVSKRTGTIKVFSGGQIDGFSFSTHRLPIKILADYLTSSIGCAVTFIGIQPEKMKFLSQPGKAVSESVNKLSCLLGNIFYKECAR
ncbi:MAG: hydrogenase 3 maturation endopeptidase HyCI [Candidatus Omnitrophica bacterium]|nr:hydrogenase 3 maturation endopeptidase HyCI [Candidatus Omnitrophota bacterium]